MPSLLIIDDRVELRNNVVDLITISLPEDSTWQVIGKHPLPDMNDYSPMILEEDIAVLLVDERLHEQNEEATGLAVAYNGHDLIAFLRERLPDFPIFAITAFPDEQPLQAKAPDVEDIIVRGDFAKMPEKYVQRMIRSGQRFADALQSELAVLAKLAENAARGQGSKQEDERMQSIRTKHSLAFPQADPHYINELIPNAEKLINEATNLLKEIRSKETK